MGQPTLWHLNKIVDGEIVTVDSSYSRIVIYRWLAEYYEEDEPNTRYTITKENNEKKEK